MQGSSSRQPDLPSAGDFRVAEAEQPSVSGSQSGRTGDLLCSGDVETDEASSADTGAGLPSAANAAGHKAVALVVDATVTSYLMMGSIPGLKRHAVTLFEGGRVSGAETMGSLIDELEGVDEKSLEIFGGEMQDLASHTAALAHTLVFVRNCAPGNNVELLRRESLAGLSTSAAMRMLNRGYSTLLPVTPMPGAPLPLDGVSLIHFGHTAESATPWMQLAMHKATGQCLPGMVFAAGQRLVRLPPELEGSTHALIWPWDPTVAKSSDTPIVVSSLLLLMSINDYLTRTALLVQPLRTRVPEDAEVGGIHGWQLDMIHVPLPLPCSQIDADEDGGDLLGVCASDGRELVVACGAGKMLCAVCVFAAPPLVMAYTLHKD